MSLDGAQGRNRTSDTRIFNAWTVTSRQFLAIPNHLIFLTNLNNPAQNDFHAVLHFCVIFWLRYTRIAPLNVGGAKRGSARLGDLTMPTKKSGTYREPGADAGREPPPASLPSRRIPNANAALRARSNSPEMAGGVYRTIGMRGPMIRRRRRSNKRLQIAIVREAAETVAV
jgi:hypothetical protein